MGSRWLISGEVSGQFAIDNLTVVPAAKMVGIWENETGYVDTLGIAHASAQLGGEDGVHGNSRG